jgi:hypothetical protein
MSEAQAILAGERPRIELPDDDPNAMKIIFEILHHRPETYSMTTDCAVSIAIVGDKYDCTRALRPWLIYWLACQEPENSAIDIGLRLLVYLILQSPSFTKLSQLAMRELCVSSEADHPTIVPVVESFLHPIPVTPVTESVIALQNLIVGRDAQSLNATSKQSLERHVAKLAQATQKSRAPGRIFTGPRDGGAAAAGGQGRCQRARRRLYTYGNALQAASSGGNTTRRDIPPGHRLSLCPGARHSFIHNPTCIGRSFRCMLMLFKIMITPAM